MTEEDLRQMNTERLKVYYELLSTTVWERYKLLPQISALAATLLIVATFNEKVIPLTNCVRLLIIFFLLLIPVSIIGYLVVLYQAENHAKKKIKDITGEELPIEKTKQNFFTAYLPWCIAGIISILIIFVVFLVWQGFTC
jgi:magnesium-transporting ATPase (P-type)